MKAEPFEKALVSQRWQVLVRAEAAEDEMAKWLFKKVCLCFFTILKFRDILWRSMKCVFCAWPNNVHCCLPLCLHLHCQIFFVLFQLKQTKKRQMLLLCSNYYLKIKKAYISMTKLSYIYFHQSLILSTVWMIACVKYFLSF